MTDVATPGGRVGDKENFLEGKCKRGPPADVPGSSLGWANENDFALIFIGRDVSD